ncbi:MAG: LuxR C-terminal-related transcriptional regulator, partial [Chloroflexi bacterium]|nr:LuxR C-terminal-related transcriptional regulator [Chloroflexota bacterium]
LAAGMWPVWYVRGLYSEGRSWLAELLDIPGTGNPAPAKARALALAGHLAYCQGEYVAAEAFLQRAQSAASDSGDEQTLAIVLQFQANLARAQGDPGRARELYGLAGDLNRRLHSPIWEAMCLVGQGQAAADQGRDVEAEGFATESLGLCRREGHTWGAARALWILGRVATSRGDFGAAQRQLQECMAYQREMGDRQGLVWAWLDLAQTTAHAGDVATAADCLAEGVGLSREVGDRLSMTRALDSIAGLVVRSDPATAVRLAGAASTMRAAIGARQELTGRAQVEAALALARRTLGDRAYDAAWASGSGYTFEQAVNEGLKALALHGRSSNTAKPQQTNAYPLTRREQEVAALLARGLTDRQIAAQLVITEGTAGVHVAHILAKLEFRSRAQIAGWVVEHGLHSAN